MKLCIHCEENPAGFWVARANAKTVRRPWCLSCITVFNMEYNPELQVTPMQGGETK